MKIFLAGEGKTELGDWVYPAHYRHSVQTPRVEGCLEALLKRVADSGWSIGGAIQWKDIRKARAGDHRTAEMRNLQGAALQAAEAGCDALVFVRDQDGDPGRQSEIDMVFQSATSEDPAVRIAGGVAIRDVEAWILACRGEQRSEFVRDTKSALIERHGIEHTAHKTAALQTANLDLLPEDAGSLKIWLDRVRALFAP